MCPIVCLLWLFEGRIQLCCGSPQDVVRAFILTHAMTHIMQGSDSGHQGDCAFLRGREGYHRADILGTSQPQQKA